MLPALDVSSLISVYASEQKNWMLHKIHIALWNLLKKNNSAASAYPAPSPKTREIVVMYSSQCYQYFRACPTKTYERWGTDDSSSSSSSSCSSFYPAPHPLYTLHSGSRGGMSMRGGQTKVFSHGTLWIDRHLWPHPLLTPCNLTSHHDTDTL